MRIVAISLLSLAVSSGCFSVHAEFPEEMVHHLARKDGVDLGAICTHDGKHFSEGAVICMAGRRAVCDPTGRWATDGECR